AANRPLDGATAEAITRIMTEVVVAPGADDAARAVFAAKKNLRLLLVDELPNPRRGGLQVKPIIGGLLVQSRDNGAVLPEDFKVVTELAPTERQLRDMLFAWTVVRHVRSNAIVFAKDGVTAGIGAGQVNRRDSARIAAIRAREAAEGAGWKHPRTIGSAMASEAFLPFADALEAAIEVGATAVIQPGGAMRDEEVIARANDAGIAMVFTGMRHFRH
ncbi:MAG TPA: bifunctional phosphoribosylaminoimidazolecarboxamide formyltransferase/IMP cyclohydrolase, partial [Croceibacterium sp.]